MFKLYKFVSFRYIKQLRKNISGHKNNMAVRLILQNEMPKIMHEAVLAIDVDNKSGSSMYISRVTLKTVSNFVRKFIVFLWACC